MCRKKLGKLPQKKPFKFFPKVPKSSQLPTPFYHHSDNMLDDTPVDVKMKIIELLFKQIILRYVIFITNYTNSY